jgi:hypothetical protein
MNIKLKEVRIGIAINEAKILKRNETELCPSDWRIK